MSKDEKKARSKPNSRPTIGYIPATVGNIGQPMLAGIVDAARERDVNMICFPGMPILTTAGFGAQSNIAFALVSPESVDGVVSWASMLGNYVSVDELEAFHERYRPLPMVTIGRTFEGFSSVLMDSYEGMREAVTHLIEVHGHRRLAFIRGPENHVYAQGRYRAYLETLEAHGLPIDPNLVTPAAPWGPGTGREAIRLLLDERGLRPGVDLEAIVSVSEDTLLGALEALETRRVQVPEDVAVVGFDDTILSQTHVPSITTVAAPFYQTGRAAANKLLDVMEGVQVPQETVVPSRLMIRQSCGCLDAMVIQAAVGPVDVQDESFESAVALRRDEILAVMGQVVSPASPGFDWEERLLDSFVGSLKDGLSGAFLSTLNGVLRQVMIAREEVSNWQGVISALRRQAAPYLDGQALRRAEDLWQQAHAMIGEAAQRAGGRQRRRAEEMARVVREIGTALIATFDLDDLADVLADRLPELGIPACYLSLYEDPQPYRYPQPAPEWSRLVLAYNAVKDSKAPSSSKRVELEPGGRRFRTLALAPDGLLPQGRQYSLVLQPLFFQQNQIGFVLFEVGPREGEIYEVLSSQISSALKGALLLRERKQAENALARQAQELTRSNTDLEQFAYVASHDLQEPLRMVKSYLQLIERRYKGQLDPDADDFIAFAVDGAERMRILIRDLLEYSRVTTSGKPFAPTTCSTVLDHVLANLKIAIEESGAVVTSDELPTVMADETQLTQLLQNLVGNAIKFRKAETRPEIHVSVEHSGGEWTFSVRDNGIGIAPEQFERIFMISRRLHTREEYEGTGIGLAVCKKIVERHGGRIWVESEPGRGSTFYFTILDSGD